MSSICIIPARGGSKRIPRKNIKEFLGKPIIAYSIEAALASNLFDEVMVSTDDGEIAEVAREYGARVPFMRTAKNADDHATTASVITEVIHSYQLNNTQFRSACCLYPTAPLVTSQKLTSAFELLCSRKFDAVFPIVRYSSAIFRSLKLENGKVQMIWPEYRNTRTQDAPIAFHDSGQFYWFHVAKFLETNEIITDNCGGIEISETESQDIDHIKDWTLAEMKYRLLHATSTGP